MSGERRAAKTEVHPPATAADKRLDGASDDGQTSFEGTPAAARARHRGHDPQPHTIERGRLAAGSTSAPPIASPRAAVAALRILIVDDHRDTTDLTDRLLRQFGHRTTTAYDFTSAARLADAEPFDLLISDVSLPDGSGLTLMTTLGPRGVKGIAVTAHGGESDIRASLAAGFACHLTKPIMLDQLVRAIDRVMA